MKKIFYPLRVAWAYWWFFIFALFFMLLYPFFLFFLSRESRYGAANRLRAIWARLICVFTGLFWEVKFEAPLVRGQRYVFVANHFSYLDIPAFALCYSGNYRFMAKAELSRIPLFNIFFRTVDISVNRSSMTESMKAFKEAGNSLQRGFSLVIFPEGGISPHPPGMMKFKNGPFKLAIDAQVPVVPITFVDNWRHLHVEEKIFGRPGRVRIRVHRPILTTGMTAADQAVLSQQVYQTIDQTLREYPHNQPSDAT